MARDGEQLGDVMVENPRLRLCKEHGLMGRFGSGERPAVVAVGEGAEGPHRADLFDLDANEVLAHVGEMTLSQRA